MRNQDLEVLGMFAGQNKTARAIEVILRAKHQNRRGKNTAMAFDRIRNPRLALLAAVKALQFYTAAPQDSLADAVKKALVISKIMGQSVRLRYIGSLFTVDSRLSQKQIVESLDDKLYEKRVSVLASWVVKELNSARFWLKRFRENPKTYHLMYIEEHLAAAGCTVEWIGGSKKELAELLREGYRISAGEWLSFMRRPNSHNDHSDYVLDDLAKGGWKLTDIGSSENDLAQLVKASHKNSAIYWLESMRHPYEHSSEHSDWVREHAAKAGCTLKDIGTDEDELAKLVKDYHKRQAQYWLKSMRSDKKQHGDYTEYVCKHAAKAECTLADIDTSEAELTQLARKYYKARASRWLNWMRFPSCGFSNYSSYIRQDCAKAGCRLADIGTCEAELTRLVRSHARR